MNHWMLLIIVGLFPFILSGQGSNIPLGNPVYPILDRLEIKTGLPAPYHSSLKYYTRGAATQYALTIDTASVSLTSRDRFDLYYIFKESNEWLIDPVYPTTLTGKRETAMKGTQLTQMQASLENPRFIETSNPILKYFYHSPANFFEINEDYFHLRVNPILNLKMGNGQNEDQPIFNNQRGLEVRGGVDDRVYFYMNILETQASFPNYVNERIDRDGAIPGAGLFKDYQSDIFGIDNGYDFLNGQGYLGFNVTWHLGVQFGYGRNFIGNGYRSLLLSNFSNNYLYLKLNWKVWKFHYQNLFAELSAISDARVGGADLLVPKKYMAAHHLSFNITPNINIGIFESVVFSRNDHFEFQYLNPVIFYRLVEQGLGSPDNVLIGLDGKWNFLRRFQLYGQFVLDEFVFSELITNNRGWWANKYGLQLGLKYINAFGVDHLDLQMEYNTARPYTYSHRDSSAHYTHYNQPLAHPLGANFREQILLVKYQPTKRLEIDTRFIMGKFGEDSDSTNWGGNILIPNVSRESDFDNDTTQGIDATTLIFGLDISYRLAHNIFIDLHYFFRDKDSIEDDRDDRYQYIGGGFRMNIGKQRMDF